MAGPCDAILNAMTSQSDQADPNAAFLHGLLGTVLLAIGGVLVVNVDENPELFIVLTVAFTAPGLYLLIVGAVAAGISLSRRLLPAGSDGGTRG